MALARAYIDTVQASIGSLAGSALIDALERLEDAYDAFPELELDRPRGKLLEGLRSTAESMPDQAAIPLLMYCASASPSSSSSLVSLIDKIIKSDYRPSLPAVLRSLIPSRGFCWRTIEPVINALRQQGRTETVLQLISEILSCTEFPQSESAAAFGDILIPLLSYQPRLGIDSVLLALAVRSARRRLSHSAPARREPGSREVLLAMANRLRASPSHKRLNPPADLAWPSGRMSFDEFLLQWPCEVELPLELDDTAFIDEAYRAILLREPNTAETTQYLRLLQDDVASKSSIVEDLLASEELRSLDRRVRVICGGELISEPGGSGAQQTPTVIWPRKQAN